MYSISPSVEYPEFLITDLGHYRSDQKTRPREKKTNYKAHKMAAAGFLTPNEFGHF
jgi:hypothetical protein